MTGAQSAAASGAARATDARWTENRASSGWLPSIGVAELWSYRDLGLLLALKGLKVRYKQTFLGVLWVVAQPLLGVAIFAVFLGRVAGLTGAGYPYPLFLYTGLIAWFYISTAVSAAAATLVEQRELLTKIYFPRLLAPLAAVVPPLVDLAVSIGLAAAFMVAYDARPSLALLLLPAWVLAAAALALAVGTLLAALNVRYRDVRHALGFLLQVWLFASPVVFSSSIVPDSWRYVYALNPTVGIIDGFRWSFASGPSPGVDVFVSLGVIVVLLLGAVTYFRRVERHFADIV